MTQKEYTAQVLAALHRVTEEEREAIRAEIDAHMEDHICALLELGYPAELAEERTLALMGDPAEVGRELNKHYTNRVWVILGRIAFWVTALLCAMALFGFGVLFHARDSILYRFSPPEPKALDQTTASADLNIRLPVGNDILWVYHVSTGVQNDRQTAKVSMCAYNRIPGGIVSEQIFPHISILDQRGDPSWDNVFSGGAGSWGGTYTSCYVDIQPGDTYVTLHYERFGEAFTVDIPLPEEGTT